MWYKLNYSNVVKYNLLYHTFQMRFPYVTIIFFTHLFYIYSPLYCANMHTIMALLSLTERINTIENLISHVWVPFLLIAPLSDIPIFYIKYLTM